MQRLLLAAATALIMAWPLLAQPAASSAHSELDCPFEGVSAEQRGLAASAGAQRLTDVPTDGEQRGGAALAAILANVARCMETRRWSQNQRGLALRYVLMQLTREDMLRRYDVQSVDLRFIDEAVATSQPGVEPPFDAFVARVRAQGVGDNRPDSAGDIVYIYMMLAYQTAEIRAHFADPSYRLH
jgi:hypothetical protein